MRMYRYHGALVRTGHNGRLEAGMPTRLLVMVSALLAMSSSLAEVSGDDYHLPLNGETGVRDTAIIGEAVEQYQTLDGRYTPWSVSHESEQRGDSAEMKRVKVCRAETLCKLRYTQGYAHRARVKNLVAPLHYGSEGPEVTALFIEQVKHAVDNLRPQQNVVIKFIGHSDNRPLTAAQAGIYTDVLGLTRAQAGRVARAVQEALGLPASAIDIEGLGDKRPLAPNDSAKGRMLNRRVEVEFWYDDPLQALPDEPQRCPEAGAQTLTRVYHPPSGPIGPIYFEQGNPVLPAGYSRRLQQLMGEIADKDNVRLRFIGYLSNERLQRRTTDVYGDDIGLSTARARRVMEKVRGEIPLTDAQVEHSGRGFVQSDDVANTGFVESGRSRVVVQLVYDEQVYPDDWEGMEITRITREVVPKNPYALNLMRITVDGQPLDDPGKSIPDVQRCTDVALGKANIQFKFDNLDFKPRLNVSAWPATVRYQDDSTTTLRENEVRFRLYSNYRSFIDHAELRLFDKGQSLREEPLAIVPVDADGYARWHAQFSTYQAPVRELTYLLRVYDREGRYDETAEQSLWIVERVDTDKLNRADAQGELLVGYGENRLARQEIPLKGGAVKAYGDGVPAGYSVWLAGRTVPLSRDGEFVAEELLPHGLHAVEVALLDEQGNGELFLRDLELKHSDWFYVGIADMTMSADRTSGPARLFSADNTDYDNDFNSEARFAFFSKGTFGDGWELTTSADTREGELDEMFTHFLSKAPDSVFRRIDPDTYYPSYGDDSSVEEGAPTLGKFYAKLKRHEDYGLWGNFRVGYVSNSLAHVERSLYGANLHLQSDQTTSFGEQRFFIDGFVADPGTVASREEFRGTGGSLYYLRHQDMFPGSEHLRIEIRDKDSGIVVAVKDLTPSLDYDIDYIQGRILLSEPLSSSVPDEMLVDSGLSSGNQAYLVARYEYTPGFDEVDTLALGGRTHYWVNDHLRLGLTVNRDELDGAENRLVGKDITLRKNTDTWMKVEVSATQGAGVDTLASADGGYTFDDTTSIVGAGAEAEAHRVDTSLALNEIVPGAQGKMTLYHQRQEAGFSAPGLTTDSTAKHYGGSLQLPMGERVNIRAKSDKTSKEQGLETSAHELDMGYLLDDHWTVSGGVRLDRRVDNSVAVPATQEQGKRADVVIKGHYDSKSNWDAYGFVQDTVEVSGNRDDNDRVGAGGSYRLNERLRLNGEISAGDLGGAGKLGTEYLYSDRTNLYLNYALENERADNGLRARKGSVTSGFRSHYSDTASVYLEERYTYGDVPTGLTHATGVDLAPNDNWNYGASFELGTLKDPITAAATERKAIGLNLGYTDGRLSVASALEYRFDENEKPDDASISERTTWLTKNSLRYQINSDWQMLGKINYSVSDSSLGDFYNGEFTEAVLGYAFRPVHHDQLNALFKYTYFYNLPTVDQVTIENSAAEYIQKSNIFSLDVSYDLSRRLTLGQKYAYRMGQLSPSRDDPEFFDSSAQLFIVHADWHFVHEWDALFEVRELVVAEADDRRRGILTALYRHMGENLKIGGGYNFTDFSDDLTDINYNSYGFFINVVGKF